MRRLTAVVMGAALAAPGLALAQSSDLVFYDIFEAGPSPLWGNERGGWLVQGAEYRCASPSNNPPTLSSLPFTLGDFSVDVDVLGVSDGGVFLRLSPDGNSGVLLVTGGFLRTGRGLYWHTLRNGQYSGFMNQSPPLFNQGDNVHLSIVVTGSHYAAYVNGIAPPVTTLDTDDFPSGRVGLYDFSTQRFDNVSIYRGGCATDVDNGSGTGRPDGGVTIDDLLYYLSLYAAGDERADLDNGTGGGHPDGGVTVEDLLFFLGRFAAGC